MVYIKQKLEKMKLEKLIVAPDFILIDKTGKVEISELNRLLYKHSSHTDLSSDRVVTYY